MQKLNYNEIDWNSIYTYDLTSPSGLRWTNNVIGGKGAIVKKAGQVAGYRHTYEKEQNGCWYVGYKGTLYKMHRIIWVMHHGKISEKHAVDHVDGNPWNNDINNLRVVSQQVNMRNIRKRSDNSSGNTGVQKMTRYSKLGETYYWVAVWKTIEGKVKSKCFSVNLLGDKAFELACEYRRLMIETVNKAGAGFTDRHGQ